MARSKLPYIAIHTACVTVNAGLTALNLVEGNVGVAIFCAICFGFCLCLLYTTLMN